MIRIAVLACLVAVAAPAYADSPKLTIVRKAIEDVRYDDARRLLVEALRSGTNTPEELQEIYRLSAATAQVLGQSDLAEQYYRRLLALDPDAKLPADASPKLRAPFIAAQAYMAAQGRLEVTAEAGADTVVVALVSDPLNMVAGVESGDAHERLSMSQREAKLPRGPAGISVLDEHGNELLAVRVSIAPPPANPPPREEPKPQPAGQLPLVRRWQTWAIPAGVALAAGVGFAIDGARAKTKLDDILANDEQFFFDDAEDQRKRWQRDTIIAGIAFGVAATFTVTSIIMAVRRPGRARVTATLDPHGGGIAVRASF